MPFVLLACTAFAQYPASDDDLAPLRSEPLVVWVLQPGQPLNRATVVPAYRAPKPGYTTATAGEFGQTSSTFGQTAGSYGVSSDSKTISTPPSGTGYTEQTSGDYGQTAGSFGHAASEHGGPASALGQSASNAGQNAGDAGQTAGDFGHSLSTIANAGVTDAQAMAKAAKKRAPSATDTFRDNLISSLTANGEQFHGQPRFLLVDASQLMERLAEVQGSEDYPDVVMGYPVLPPEWVRIAKDRGVVTLGTTLLLPQKASLGQTVTVQRPGLELAVVLGAPHPQAARAYALWVTDPTGSLWSSFPTAPSKGRKAGRAAAATAVAVVNGILAGNSVGDADPEMAEFSAMLARQAALNAAVDGALETRLRVLRVDANERFAVVSLRVVASSDRAFGVVHPVLVLRRADDGRWRVLQLTTNLNSDQESTLRRRLAPLISSDAAAQLGEVSLDAPSDGDTRPLTPELGWENGGGASVVVVEWQYGQGGAGSGSWADSHLYFVTEGITRAQTRVNAQFAAWPGSYRWRVWLVGKGGALKLSAWRKVNVVK